MKFKVILNLLALSFIFQSLFFVIDCIHSQHFGQVNNHDVQLATYRQRARSALSRQNPFIPTILSGPLALATFLFALPILPSLLMAPLAIAGIPPALNVLTSVMSSLTNGRPLNSFLPPFGDPLQNSDNPESSDPSKPVSQIAALKSFAKMFRAAIGRRYMVNKVTSETPSPLKPESVDVEGVLPDLTDVTLTANVTETPNIVTEVAKLQKSLKGVDMLYSSLRDVYSVIRNGLRRYEITDTDCQSRIVCEIHQKIISRNQLLKTFSLSALDVLRLEKHVDKWSTLNERSKQAIKFYINAAKSGFADKDCNQEYHKCPTLGSRSLRHLLPHLALLSTLG